MSGVIEFSNTNNFKASQVTTSSTPTALADVSFQMRKGVYLKALSGNSAPVFIGNSDVSATLGYPLNAGDYVFIPIDKLSKVFYYSAASQTLAYVAS